MQVPAVLTGKEEFGEFSSGAQTAPTCHVKLYIGNNGSCDVSDVDICVHAAWPVTVQEDSYSITCLRAGGGTPCIINLSFSYDRIQLPCSREVRFVHYSRYIVRLSGFNMALLYTVFQSELNQIHTTLLG